jgi:hypothetical protein
MEYHVEQTRPIHSTTVALQAAKEALKSLPPHRTEPLIGCVNHDCAKCKELESQEPVDLKHIDEQDCLIDVDKKAWRSLVENRGGCRCHISPPCSACSNPISEEEMNELGYTYTTPPQRTEQERDEILQAITDPENQPSQFGTVTLEYHEEKIKQWEELFDRMHANFERASDKAIAQRTEQEPVAWPCLIDSADFSENTITLVMQCEDYKVSAGTHWLSTTPPEENT